MGALASAQHRDKVAYYAKLAVEVCFIAFVVMECALNIVVVVVVGRWNNIDRRQQTNH
jgi:hypothetical protein